MGGGRRRRFAPPPSSSSPHNNPVIPTKRSERSNPAHHFLNPHSFRLSAAKGGILSIIFSTLFHCDQAQRREKSRPSFSQPSFIAIKRSEGRNLVHHFLNPHSFRPSATKGGILSIIIQPSIIPTKRSEGRNLVHHFLNPHSFRPSAAKGGILSIIFSTLIHSD